MARNLAGAVKGQGSASNKPMLIARCSPQGVWSATRADCKSSVSHQQRSERSPSQHARPGNEDDPTPMGKLALARLRDHGCDALLMAGGQHLPCLRRTGDGRWRQSARRCMCLTNARPRGDTPVSYTHLDVYKRQEQDRLELLLPRVTIGASRPSPVLRLPGLTAAKQSLA